MNTAIYQKDLLLEIGLEELPTQAVEDLSAALLEIFKRKLDELGIGFSEIKRYATARRLALLVRQIDTQQADQVIEKRGPALAAAKDKDGNWSRAASGFANSCGVSPDELVTEATAKGEWLFYKGVEVGQSIEALLPDLIHSTLAELPISKRMRWGANKDSFVRPLTSFVLMLDNEVVDCELMGLCASNTALGHRFHGDKSALIKSALDYEATLEAQYVIADIDKRRDSIIKQVEKLAAGIGAEAIINKDTLREVNALVEWPVAILGDFNERYLTIPQEVLIKTMQDNQKYFPLVDSKGKLLAHFITVANIESEQPEVVKIGNQRVIEPRFADAEFFWNNDRKISLDSRRESLKKVVYQQKLGSLYERSKRIKLIAEHIANQLNINPNNVARAAVLAKCDLLTEMVFEFGELQGIIGEYYAEHDGENSEVANAIREQYLPKFAGDELPQTQTGLILSLADKIENIVGGFAVGAKPTGTKDPYALRRASLGVIRLLNETKLNLELSSLLAFAGTVFPGELQAETQPLDIQMYINERLKGYYLDKGVHLDVFEAVAAIRPVTIKDYSKRIEALSQFIQQPDAANLFAANKRISNILKKSMLTNDTVDTALLTEPAEKALFEKVAAIKADVNNAINGGDYMSGLTTLAVLREPLDNFFDNVMVMSDDTTIKNNRLALLSDIRSLFLAIADVSLIVE